MTLVLERDSPNNALLNKDYEIDVAYTFQYTRWFLGILGVWPLVKKNPKKWEFYSSFVIITICSCLIAFVMIPCTLHIIFVEKDTLTRINLLGPISFSSTNLLKYLLIIITREMLKRCIEHVEMDWMSVDNEDERNIMKKNIHFGRELTLICTIFMYFGGISFTTFVPFFRERQVNAMNETMKPQTYIGFDLLVDSQKRPNYEIIFATSWIASCIMYVVVSTTCNLAAIFVAHACGQMEIIILRLEKLFDCWEDESEDILQSRISIIVNSHVRVLRFTEMIEKTLRGICLVEMIASTANICFLEYWCLVTWNDSETMGLVTYSILIGSMSFNIFIFCHIGESLKEQSTQIGIAAYMTDWYRSPGKTGEDLLMIMAMANRSRKLTAGNMMDISIANFGMVLKTSVVYLNVLRTMSDEQTERKY